MSTNAYIYSEDDKHCWVIDPGGDLSLICSEISERNLVPRGIICTHGHLDHTAEAGPLYDWCSREGYEVWLGIHPDDKDYLGDKSEETHRTSFASLGIIDTGYFAMIFKPSPEATHYFEDGERVSETSLRVIHTPGHTEGGICLYNEKEKILISGDTLFWRGVGRTDLPGGDMGKIVTSIRERVFTLPEDTKVYPGHGPETVIGAEKEHNPFIY